MDLYKEWKKLDQEKFSNQTIQKTTIMSAIHQESSSAIYQLKKSLRHKINWVIFFITGIVIWMLFSLQRPELLLIQGVFLAYYVLAFVTLWLQYRKMGAEPDLSENTLTVMKNNAGFIKKAIDLETRIGLFVFPIAIVGGMLISRHYDGVTLAETFSDARLLTFMLVLVIILVPILHFAGKKMNNMAFGKHINRLDENIRRMEELV
jgi:Ca2+/Na+ antiporter